MLLSISCTSTAFPDKTISPTTTVFCHRCLGSDTIAIAALKPKTGGEIVIAIVLHSCCHRCHRHCFFKSGSSLVVCNSFWSRIFFYKYFNSQNQHKCITVPFQVVWKIFHPVKMSQKLGLLGAISAVSRPNFRAMIKIVGVIISMYILYRE